MEEKILVKVICTDVDENFDIFIPVNEYIWKVKKIVLKLISEITSIKLQFNNEYVLINKDTAEIYDDNSIVINTNIRNTTELVLYHKSI